MILRLATAITNHGPVRDVARGSGGEYGAPLPVSPGLWRLAQNPVALPRAPRILSNLHASEELIETLAIMHRHEEDSSAQKDTGRQGMSNDVPNVMFPCVSGPHRAHPTP